MYVKDVRLGGNEFVVMLEEFEVLLKQG